MKVTPPHDELDRYSDEVRSILGKAYGRGFADGFSQAPQAAQKTVPIGDAKNIYDALKKLRRQRRMTQQEVGDRAGISRTSLTNIEAGRQNVTLENLYGLASALGVQVAIVFHRGEDILAEIK